MFNLYLLFLYKDFVNYFDFFELIIMLIEKNYKERWIVFFSELFKLIENDYDYIIFDVFFIFLVFIDIVFYFFNYIVIVL